MGEGGDLARDESRPQALWWIAVTEAQRMKPYIVIVHKDENSAYGMTFPDAPGCFSAADEIDDLFAMANEALEGWTETMIEFGNPLPSTRDLSEIKADPEWADSFEDALMLLALPPPRPEMLKQAA